MKTWREHEAAQNQNWEVGSVSSAVTDSTGGVPLVFDSGEKSMPKAAISPNNRMSMFSHAAVMQNRTAASPNVSSNFPTDEEILAEIRNILTSADLMTLTKKQVRESLSVKFGGVDLKSKREYINQMIDMILKGG